MILLISLFIQYLLGMFANLFVLFPENVKNGQAWVFAWSQWPIKLHIIWGILLFIGALVFLIRCWRAHSAVWKWPSVWGFIGIVLAALGGSSFIPTQSDAYSYFMSLAFLISLVAYAWGLATERAIKKAPNTF